MASMATVVLNEIFDDLLKLEINREATLLRLIAKKANRKPTISWEVNVGGAQAVGLGIAADAPSSSYDSVQPARLPHDSYSLQTSFTVNEQEVAEAAEVAPEQLKDLVGSLMTSAVDQLMSSMNTLLYTGDGSGNAAGIFGLQTAVGTGDYAGISVSSYPVWTSYVLDTRTYNFGTENSVTFSADNPNPLTQEHLFELEAQIRAKGGTYDLILTHPQVLKKYKALFATNRTFVVSDNKLADLGFGIGEYAGVPIIDDPFCPTRNVVGADGFTYLCGDMYFLRLSDLEFFTIPTRMSAPLSGVYATVQKLSKTAVYVQKYGVAVIPQMRLTTRKNAALLKNIRIRRIS
jgi:hypothetical protein